MRKTAVVLCSFAGLVVAAGDPAGFVLLKSSDLKSIDKQLGQKLTPQKTATQQFDNFGSHSMLIAHMEGSGQAEIHENVTDVFIIQSGEANLTVGGKVLGGQTTAPGEVRGTSIEGGVTRRLGAGDIVNIPAGTPHHTQVEPGQKVSYFVVKVRAK
jgi:mannose-6-phosphate isomerase-like protein (cupin superfamily)